MQATTDPEVYLVVTGPQGSRTISLEGSAAWTIGREAQHAIVLSEEGVSRKHAMIQWASPGDFYLIDLGSRNGSYVNGTRVSIPSPLHDGDRISIGESTLTFHAKTPARELEREGRPTQLDQTVANFASRLLTVLVVDIRDFVGLSQSVEQKVLCEAIGTWFRLGGKIVHEHGSWTQKYIGDAIMSVWVHMEDRAAPKILPIVQAYLELAAMTAEIDKQFQLPRQLRIGAGINTGVALIGNTGSASISDFTAIGESVNAAFRIESATRQLNTDLVLGEKTYGYLRSAGLVETYFTRHVVELKGFNEPATVWSADQHLVQSFVAAATPTHCL